MHSSESVEFFTQDEDSEGKDCSRSRSHRRHARITIPPIANIFLTPANSSTCHNVINSRNTECKTRGNDLKDRKTSPRQRKHHHRSRSLSIHIRPAAPASRAENCRDQRAQTNVFNATPWEAPYNPPSQSCSNCSTNTTWSQTPTIPCTPPNYHVYQPTQQSSESESEQFCADTVIQNLCEDKCSPCSKNKELPAPCAENFAKRNESSSESFGGHFQFTNVRTLPRPSEVRKLSKSGCDRQDDGNRLSECPGLFPFKKTPSGNFKIDKNMVAFESNQVAVLVDNPKRTCIKFKQSRHFCPSAQPPPVPPMPKGCSRDPSPLCKSRRDPESEIPPPPKSFEGTKPERQDPLESSPPSTLPTATLESPIEVPADLKHGLIGCDNNTDMWNTQAEGQCRNYRDFEESFRCRLQRAKHADMKVVVHGKEFPCHSIALQAYSHYFDKLKRPKETIHVVKFPTGVIEPDDFPSLMDWILLDDPSKPRVISATNVLNLYCASKVLGMPGLKEDCVAFLKEKIQAGDPLILQLYERASQKPKCKELLSSLAAKLVQLFPVVYKTKQFLKLGVNELVTLLGSDHIKIHSELQVYDTSLRWLLHDWKKRCIDAVRVMGCVRFGLLTPLQLTQIQHFSNATASPEQCHLLSNPAIKEMLQQGLTYAILQENYKSRPSEFNKWLEMSKCNPPRPRSNMTEGPDLFEPQTPLHPQESCHVTRDYDTTILIPKLKPTDVTRTNGECQYISSHSNNHTDEPGKFQDLDFRPESQVFLSAQPSDSNTAVRDVSSVERKTNDETDLSNIDSPRTSVSPKRYSKPGVSHKFDLSDPVDSANGHSNMGEQTPRHDSHDYDDKMTRRLNYGDSETFQVSTDPDLNNNNNRGIKSPKPQTTHKESEKLSIPKNPLPQRRISPPNIFKDRAARLIQAHYQGYLVRRKFLVMKAAATAIQRFYRAHRKLKAERKAEITRTKMLLIPGREVVLLFGGMNPLEEYGPSNNCQSVYRFNPDENLWADMGMLPEPRSHCGVVYHQDSIYIFGGTDPRKQTAQGKSLPSAKAWSLNPLNGRWREMALMGTRRTNFGFCNFHGRVYVFGGKDTSGAVLSTCERFDPSVQPNGSWTPIMSLPFPCMSMAVSKLGDKIYIIGGVGSTASGASTGSKRPILNSVLVYDPKRNSWSVSNSSLAIGRCYSAAQSHYGRLYLVGGAGKGSGRGEGTKSLQDVSVFEDGEWERVGLLKTPRHGHSLVKIGKYFLIMGGVSSDTMEPLDTVELFNTETNRSSSRVTPIPQPLTGMAGVLI